MSNNLNTVEESYDRHVSSAVNAGKKFLQENSRLVLEFNTNAKFGLEMGVQPDENVTKLIQNMDAASGGLSCSSVNLALGQLIDYSIVEGRKVSYYRVGSQHKLEISPSGLQ